MKTAFVTGAGGQTGSYLCELLLEKGYSVHALVRRTSLPNTGRIDHILNRLTLHTGDMADAGSLSAAIAKAQPDEVYNLAAMSHVRISYDKPAYTLDITGVGFARLIEAVRQHAPNAKVYQAGSSEMFGKVQQVPQTEATPFYPRSPYGVAKAAAFYLARSYREGYGMKVYNGILFNHESPRRGETFLSKKVVQAAVRIRKALDFGDTPAPLVLGNLDAKRDFGSAKDYAYWIWRILQHKEPDDFVIATGETHSIEEFVDETFKAVKLDWREFVKFDENLKRPAEVDLLIGDATKARKLLGFRPCLKFKELVAWMVAAEQGLPSEHDNQWPAMVTSNALRPEGVAA